MLFELHMMIAGKGKQSIEMICCLVVASRSSLQKISPFNLSSAGSYTTDSGS